MSDDTQLIERVARVLQGRGVALLGLDVPWDSLSCGEKLPYVEDAKAVIDEIQEATKPKWEDAPEWANWLAMDEDGAWMWYDERPSPERSISRPGLWVGPTYLDGDAAFTPLDWQSSLEPRPEGE